ncbi:unnamed protein product [Linum tenue]|uniref:RRM domain-containing protein n=1 Tax=Linum tenue TaxID=586396 RepID=A0AAV0PYN4_9ROSI|nr:unnamed protein product [Linum tenue]
MCRHGHSKSPSPPPSAASPPRARRSRSLSRSRKSRSRSRESVEAYNPGNNLYVTGLSTRVTSSDLEKFFAKEGKVLECNLVLDPRSKESRGFAFITMETTEAAERCIKYLNRSVLEGRLVTVEKGVVVRGAREATHLVDVTTESEREIRTQGIDEADHGHHLEEGRMIIMIPIEGTEKALHQQTAAATVGRRQMIDGVVKKEASPTYCYIQSYRCEGLILLGGKPFNSCAQLGYVCILI